jgi:5-methylcytosine-specific restriction endonuclease McrA
LEQSVTPVPSDADQLEFLIRIQKILDEGQFVATYKFALLVALIEIAIERGNDSGESLEIKLDWLAEKFIELYWGHAREFCGTVLSQNKGANIAVIHQVAKLQREAPQLSQARRIPLWRTTVLGIRGIVRAMPLFRLQLLRGDQRIPFLYEEVVNDGAIHLKPGIAFCLRKFSALISSLARGGWLREVRDNPRNAYAIGQTQSLEAFLFGEERVPLRQIREVLIPLQQGKCFYCSDRLTEAMHVDHFIPWVLYPSNLGHNFVLADASCNTDKSDLLADISHFDRWRKRNDSGGAQLNSAFEAHGVIVDLAASSGIARWAYERARSTSAVVWVARRSTRVMPADLRMHFQ